MKKITENEELIIYRRLLIELHTSIWTGHNDKVKEILKAIGDYSYARTNSNGDWKQEEELRIITLMNLKKLTE
jgi:hypothetical protein